MQENLRYKENLRSIKITKSSHKETDFKIDMYDLTHAIYAKLLPFFYTKPPFENCLAF